MILANSCSPSDCFLIKTELFLRKLPKAKERPTTRVKVESFRFENKMENGVQFQMENKKTKIKVMRTKYKENKEYKNRVQENGDSNNRSTVNETLQRGKAKEEGRSGKMGT